MRSVTVWACGCGVRYKAICEVDPKVPKETSVICPNCQGSIKIHGVSFSCEEEIAQGQWRSVSAMSSLS